MSDLESCTTSVDSDTEGSLADFIVHDEDEEEDDEEFENEGVDDASTDNGSALQPEEKESEEESEGKEEDDEADVRAQYTETMEQEGLITTENGLRRSARINKGRAPVRYVDEDYIGLMTSDVDSDVQWSSEEEGSED
jgi:hypothetical protein